MASLMDTLRVEDMIRDILCVAGIMFLYFVYVKCIRCCKREKTPSGVQKVDPVPTEEIFFNGDGIEKRPGDNVMRKRPVVPR